MNELDKAYYFGIFIGWFLTTSFYAIIYLPPMFSKKEKLMSATKSIVDYKNGFVTVTDLVLNCNVSPEKAKKFLTELTQKLNIEPEVEEQTGTIFYRFVSARKLEELEREKEINQKFLK